MGKADCARSMLAYTNRLVEDRKRLGKGFLLKMTIVKGYTEYVHYQEQVLQIYIFITRISICTHSLGTEKARWTRV